MAINERHDAIMTILKEKRRANVAELASTLFVSEATVRRDLSEMQKLGLIERSHGGAVLSENAEEVSIFVRMNKNSKQKEQTASNALPHIPQFHSIFVDSSSTALALAERMDLAFKTVVTNNLQTAIILSGKKDINLIILGGSVQYNTVSSTGSFTARQIEEFSFDLMISSCTAVSGNEVYESSLEQKEIKLAAMKRSKYKILLFDSEKYGAYGAYKIAALSDFDLAVTNNAPPDEKIRENVRIIY
ncbi:MAG: DeoR/GlpR transcriptional regulator [Ruminococcaceae bacterium]|nr:DeoR/GlpR transcriptional regulator [Oscillospiraceae bacterium]